MLQFVLILAVQPGTGRDWAIRCNQCFTGSFEHSLFREGAEGNWSDHPGNSF